MPATLEWNNSQYLKAVFNLVREFGDEATFTLNPEGLELKQMNPARETMLWLKLEKHGCESYDISTPIKFCFNVDRFIDKFLKNTYKDESLQLEIPDDKVKMEVALKQRNNRKFSVTLLESSEEECPLPRLTHDFKVRVLLDDLNTTFKDIDDSGATKIIANSENISFEQNGDLEKFSVTFRKDYEILDIESKVNGEIQNFYNSGYLKAWWQKLKPLSDIATLSFSKDMPIEINVELGNYGSATVYLAPRIEEE